jgi:hypothetical protein
MPDYFPRAGELSDPPVGLVAIDYSGGNQTFTVAVRGVQISTAGTLNVIMVDGTTGVVTVQLGTTPMRIRTILQASSTAAGVVWL